MIKLASFSPQHFLRANILPLLIVLIVTLIGLIGSDLAIWLRYDRDGILTGDYWRIITGHFVHLTWPHLGMNIAGLLLIWALFGRLLSNKAWLWVISFSCIYTSLSLLIFNEDLYWYVGFSGVLHGLFIVGCIFDMRIRRIDGLLLLTAVSSKLAWEQISGPLPGSESTAGGKVIVDAHLYGAISGLLVTLIILLILRYRVNNQVSDSANENHHNDNHDNDNDK